jgi:hypothetical protein
MADYALDNSWDKLGADFCWSRTLDPMTKRRITALGIRYGLSIWRRAPAVVPWQLGIVSRSPQPAGSLPLTSIFGLEKEEVQ